MAAKNIEPSHSKHRFISGEPPRNALQEPAPLMLRQLLLNMEEQMRRIRLKRQVAEFIDDQQRAARLV